MKSKLLSKIVGVVLSACLAFVVTACSSAAQPGEVGNVDASGIVHTDGANSNVELTPEPITPREISPFDEFRNILWSLDMDADSFARQFEADRLRAEDMIAQCMNELGFEYIPFPGYWIMPQIVGAIHSDDAEWVAQYGFGWTTEPSGPHGEIGSFYGGGFNFWNPDNPNLEIYESLSEDGRSSFFNALQGSGSGFPRYVNGIDHRNCNSWSSAVITFERHEVSHREEFRPLMDAIAQMHDDLHWDVSEADRAWAICMFDAGYPDLQRQWEASTLLLREMNELRPQITQNPNWEAGVNPTPENSPEMAELQNRELEMAMADFNCRVSTNFAAQREAHIHEVENQFITDHRAALEALRAASEQRS